MAKPIEPTPEITGKDAETAQKIAGRIEAKWKHDVLGVQGLSVVI